MNVLSLFDGMSCGRIALERAGIPVANYYASEIDKHAIKVSGSNYPDIIQLGSVTELVNIDWSQQKIDLLIGGSPCQDLSNAKTGGMGLIGEKSKLFFEYVRVLNEIRKVNPDVKFLLENVKMKKESENVISEILNLKPIEVNSELVSAQKRKRLYWTNIEGFTMPEDKGILLKNILEETVDEKYFYSNPLKNIDLEKEVCAIMEYNNNDIHKRILNPEFKCHTLTTCGGGNTQKKVLINGRARKLTPLEYERLQNVPENYTSYVAEGHRYNMLGNGWTVDVIVEFFKHLKPATDFNENLDF